MSIDVSLASRAQVSLTLEADILSLCTAELCVEVHGGLAAQRAGGTDMKCLILVTLPTAKYTFIIYADI